MFYMPIMSFLDVIVFSISLSCSAEEAKTSVKSSAFQLLGMCKQPSLYDINYHLNEWDAMIVNNNKCLDMSDWQIKKRICR